MRDAEVIRLPRQIGGDVIILVCLEALIAQVTPQDGRHPEFMRQCERFCNLDQLAMRIIRAEIDRRADGRGAHIVRLLDGTEQDLLDSYSGRSVIRCG